MYAGEQFGFDGEGAAEAGSGGLVASGRVGDGIAIAVGGTAGTPLGGEGGRTGAARAVGVSTAMGRSVAAIVGNDVSLAAGSVLVEG